MAASTYFDQVQQLYIAYFGRPADPVGLTFWATQVDAANGNLASMIAGFASSSESNALYAGVSTTQKITGIYVNLFNRQPEPAGLAFWVAQIESGALTQAQAAFQIQSSAGPGDALAVVNKLAIAKSFTAQLDTPAEISGYSGVTAAATARTFLASVDATPASVNTATANLGTSVATASGTTVPTPVTPVPVNTTQTLTTGIDTLTGSDQNDTFIATLDTSTPALGTFNKADSLNGGLGTDILSLSVTGAAVAFWPAATLTNIEQLLIRDQHKSGDSSIYDLGGINGLSTVTSNVSTGAVTFNNVQTGATVALLGDKATTLGAVNFSMTKTTGDISLLLDRGVTTTAIRSETSEATTVTLTSSGAANKVSLIDLGKTNTISKLLINASTDLTTVLSADDYASTATLTLTGTGKVDLGTTLGFSGSAVDASANSGGLTIALDANTLSRFIGSSGNDRLIVTGTATKGTTIDAGDGIDTLSVGSIQAGNGSVFRNFEVLDLTGGRNVANGGLLDASQLKSVITGIQLGGDTVNDFTIGSLGIPQTGFNVNVTGDVNSHSTTLNFNQPGNADVLNYTFNGVSTGAANAGTVSTAGIEIININSGGSATANVLSIVDNDLQSLVITGNHSLNVAISGQSGLSVSQLTSINGSAATGDLTLAIASASANKGQAAITIQSGSGNDTLTVVTSSVPNSFGSTISTGTGKDTIVLSGATAQDTTAVQFTTITDFAAGDQLSLGSNLNNVDFVSARFVPVAPADLGAALTQALSGVATNKAVWFTFDNDTYIAHSADAITGFSTGDVVIKLTGTTVDPSTFTTAGVNLVFG